MINALKAMVEEVKAASKPASEQKHTEKIDNKRVSIATIRAEAAEAKDALRARFRP